MSDTPVERTEQVMEVEERNHDWIVQYIIYAAIGIIAIAYSLFPPPDKSERLIGELWVLLIGWARIGGMRRTVTKKNSPVVPKKPTPVDGKQSESTVDSKEEVRQ